MGREVFESTKAINRNDCHEQQDIILFKCTLRTKKKEYRNTLGVEYCRPTNLLHKPLTTKDLVNEIVFQVIASVVSFLREYSQISTAQLFWTYLDSFSLVIGSLGLKRNSSPKIMLLQLVEFWI
ncbi:hypothetical protein NPIL_192991 [Nephila pilipes]|uniref:Uncharacterized protein n=1 Tax=Nephila pilipes TaxID=299642 RepID=A0A8X6MTN1_NEPPI|nr:hypothetical protein NPIL_192991 [Nephila pilipes]